MRKWITLLLCTLLTMTSIAAVSPSAFAEDGRILDGRWLCSNIAGNVTEDTPAELKDDFGLYVNKPWILQTEFTAGVPTVSNQSEVQIDVMNRLIGLMKDESLTGHDAELVQKLYAMTGDWDYRNAQGLSPALPYMQALAGIDSLDALLKYLCSEDRLTCTVPFNAHIMPGDTDSAVYTVYVEPSELMLEDPEEYVERSEYGQAEYDRYRQIAGYMLGRLGNSESEIDSMLDHAIAFETILVKCRTDMSLDAAEGEYTPEALSELAGSFPILDVLRSIDTYSDKSYYVIDPDYITALQTVFTEENVPLIRDWLTIDAATHMMSLPDEEAAMRLMAINTASMGGIGMIIGHEITHAFDNIGAEYDKNGEEVNWWTDEDYAAFQSRAEKLAKWYDGFIRYDGIQYSGKQVQREAIADLGSMKCMLNIAAQKENFDYDVFFRQWAKVQREKSSPEMVREEALNDSHPLGYMRINATLAQFEEFVDFYGIKEGDGMYIAPKDRLEIC